jgi:hypothetical protein
MPKIPTHHKLANLAMVDKMRFDYAVNGGGVVIKQVFGSLKNRWRFLKVFIMSVKRTVVVTLAYYVLHNYCKMSQPSLAPFY